MAQQPWSGSSVCSNDDGCPDFATTSTDSAHGRLHTEKDSICSSGGQADRTSSHFQLFYILSQVDSTATASPAPWFSTSTGRRNSSARKDKLVILVRRKRFDPVTDNVGLRVKAPSFSASPTLFARRTTRTKTDQRSGPHQPTQTSEWRVKYLIRSQSVPASTHPRVTMYLRKSRSFIPKRLAMPFSSRSALAMASNSIRFSILAGFQPHHHFFSQLSFVASWAVCFVPVSAESTFCAPMGRTEMVVSSSRF